MTPDNVMILEQILVILCVFLFYFSFCLWKDVKHQRKEKEKWKRYAVDVLFLLNRELDVLVSTDREYLMVKSLIDSFEIINIKIELSKEPRGK